MNAEKKVSIPTIYNSFSTAENNKYQQADGIYSVDRFHKKPLKPQWFQGFQAKFHYCFPLRFPLSEVQHIFDKGIHPGGTGLLHLVGDVAQVALDGLDVVAAPDGDSVRMPLWHNKDKSENPCGATGWLVCPYSFSTKNGPQMGPMGGGEKPGLH